MLFAQLSGQTGLRGIETALTSIKSMLYHKVYCYTEKSFRLGSNNNCHYLGLAEKV
ncbi:MAG TPA: hypothetical protein DCO79_13665, partial [Spirochaeta sp.]|nr:hypothetical protein [Spirochaeta sp.]